PRYGPDSLVSNADLEKVAAQSQTISSVKDLYSITNILHWSKLSKPLLANHLPQDG
ncbi:hypothetical protein B0H34DRAFT_656343, partial [Crassisporium funariophilum]